MGWDRIKISVHKFKVREKEIGSGQNCTFPAKVQENQCSGPKLWHLTSTTKLSQASSCANSQLLHVNPVHFYDSISNQVLRFRFC